MGDIGTILYAYFLGVIGIILGIYGIKMEHGDMAWKIGCWIVVVLMVIWIGLVTVDVVTVGGIY